MATGAKAVAASSGFWISVEGLPAAMVLVTALVSAIALLLFILAPDAMTPLPERILADLRFLRR